ncbi:unnamed protein product, partial [Porites evermanni]
KQSPSRVTCSLIQFQSTPSANGVKHSAQLKSCNNQLQQTVIEKGEDERLPVLCRLHLALSSASDSYNSQAIFILWTESNKLALFNVFGIEAVAFLAYHGLNYFAVYNVINNSESVSGLSWSENSQSLTNNSATQLKAHNVNNQVTGAILFVLAIILASYVPSFVNHLA